MKKQTFSLVFLVSLISLAAFASSISLSAAQSGLITFITQNTTWTKANSPYVFSGPIVVSTGVTLTINSGVTVNLNGYYLYINGTLQAQGSGSDGILILGGDTTFGAGASDSSAFSFTEINSTISSARAIAFNNDIINKDISCGNSSALSNNIITGQVTAGGSTTITNSIIKGDVTLGDSCSISGSTINGDTKTATSATIMNNVLNGSKIVIAPFGGHSYTIAVTVSSFSTITNNQITGGLRATSSTISNNVISGGADFTDWAGRPEDSTSAVDVDGTSSITSNAIWSSTGGYGILIRSGYTTVQGNNVQNSIRVAGNALIEGNMVTGSGTGIQVGDIHISAFNDIDYGSGNSIIRNNIIANNYVGIGSSYGGGTTTIQNNLIATNTYGISLASQATAIQNNTIQNSQTAIQLQTYPTTISYNNFLNYTQNSITLTSEPSNVNAANNWWGSTDIQAINLTIHDFKYDLNLGIVNIVPILNAQNEAAPSTSYTLNLPPIPPQTPNPTPSPTPTPTGTPAIPEYTMPIVLLAAVIATMLSLIVIRRTQKRKN